MIMQRLVRYRNSNDGTGQFDGRAIIFSETKTAHNLSRLLEAIPVPIRLQA